MSNSRAIHPAPVVFPREVLLALYIIRQIKSCLPDYVKNQEFADEIMIESTDSDITIAAANLSVAVTSLSGWLSERGLELNKQKTHTMFIPPSAVQLEPENVVVSCCGQRLSVVAVFGPPTRLRSNIRSPCQQLSEANQTISFCSVEGESITDSDIKASILPHHGPVYSLLRLECLLSIHYSRQL